MEKSSNAKLSEGVTFIEMLVVLAIVALTLSLGSYLLQPLLQRSKIKSEAHRMLGAINLARSEAVLRNVPVTLCPSSMHRSQQAVCAGNYSDGWIVFSNADKDRAVDVADDEVLQVYAPIAASLVLSNRAGSELVKEAIHYLPDGSSHRNRTLMFCSTVIPRIEDLSIVVNIVGRARLQKGWGHCPAVSV